MLKKFKTIMKHKLFLALVLLVPALLVAQPAAQSKLSHDDLIGLLSGADPAKPNRGVTPGYTRQGDRPVLFIIGDSTVKNGRGDGSNKQWGWGSFLHQMFDTTRISVENHALGGRSSRTFIQEGLWQGVYDALQPGDFVLIQFGHNDMGPLNTGRARAVLRGNGDQDTTVVMEADGKEVTINSFGWYMRKYAAETKSKKATPILLTHIPRNQWTTADSVAVRRNADSFGVWTSEAAKMAKAPYIDFNAVISDRYDELGKTVVPSLFHGDWTHTSLDGALLNAAILAENIATLKGCKLKKYLRKEVVVAAKKSAKEHAKKARARAKQAKGQK